MTKPIIIATDRAHLRKLVLKEIRTDGPDCDLNHIDVSGLQDMVKIFLNTPFSGNVSQWDTRQARSMEGLFMGSQFNGDLTGWNVACVENMQDMFRSSPFNGNIAGWNVAQVTNTQGMFRDSRFTGDLTTWHLDNLRRGHHMFQDSSFQGGMPKMAERVGYIGEFPTMYRGSMNDYYSLNRLAAFFKQKRWVDWYLEQTFVKRVDRVHIEKIIALATCPKWCTDPSLFKWVKEQQGLCEQLGLAQEAVMSVVVQQFQNKKVALVELCNTMSVGDLFSTHESA